MSIELLWIIPIVAVALLILVLVLNLQQNNEEFWDNGNIKDLKREVAAFNNGIHETNNIKTETQETRLRDIENTIQLVSTALSNQQKIIENFRGDDEKVGDELKNLKLKLYEIQNEYDTITSENFTLRARLKKIEKQTGDHDTQFTERKGTKLSSEKDDEMNEKNKVLNMTIYDKHKDLKYSKPSYLDASSDISSLHDTAEIIIIDKNSKPSSKTQDPSQINNTETGQCKDGLNDVNKKKNMNKSTPLFMLKKPSQLQSFNPKKPEDSIDSENEIKLSEINN